MPWAPILSTTSSLESSFASGACVSSSWNSICSRILSVPKLSSAISLNPSLEGTVNEIAEKVSNSLTQLAKTRLNKHRKEITPHDIPRMFQNTESLVELAEMKPAELNFQMHLMCSCKNSSRLGPSQSTLKWILQAIDLNLSTLRYLKVLHNFTQ